MVTITNNTVDKLQFKTRVSCPTEYNIVPSDGEIEAFRNEYLVIIKSAGPPRTDTLELFCQGMDCLDEPLEETGILTLISS